MIPSGWWAEKDVQPGDHLSERRPTSLLAKVHHDPFYKQPHSARAAFVKFVIAPVLLVMLVLFLILLAQIGVI